MKSGSMFQVANGPALDEIFAGSEVEPRLLFLHDPYCPISARAEAELFGFAGVGWIDVSDGHSLSRAVAERTGVRHESPQLFVLSHGRVAWSGSHGAITAGAVQRALQDCATAATAAD